jgi:hypothetical protein
LGFALPVSHTAPTDYGLGDRDHNRQQAKRLLSGEHNVLHEDNHVVLGMSTHASLIEIFLFRKAETAITYYLRSEVAELELLGSAATEVALWRRAAPGLKGGTSGIIFTLLDVHNAVVSHASITPAGQRYWIDRMAEAHLRGWAVGVTDGDTLVEYQGERCLLEWVQNLADRDDEDAPQRNCLFISKATRRGDRRMLGWRGGMPPLLRLFRPPAQPAALP